MLCNSIAAAGLAAAYVIVLVLLLNPGLSLRESLLPLVATVGAFYAVYLTAVFYALLLLRQLLARVVFSPAWISVGALVWLCAMSATAGAALMWRNVDTFGRVLDPESATALNRSALVLTAAAALCVVLAELRRRSSERRVLWFVLLVLTTTASVVAPLAFRGAGARALLEAGPIDAPGDVPLNEGSAHVIVVAIDAGSLDFITRATADGRLPNFGRLLDAGAVRHLATLHPTSPDAVWAAVATGKLPQKNGVRSASIYQISVGGGS